MIMSWLKSQWDTQKLEVTLRIGVMSLCGYILSIANIPSVVPPSSALMCGLLAAIFSQLLPALVYTLVAIIPSFLVMFVGIAGATSMLLAAGSVSNGLLMGIYAVFTLLMTTLFFGDNYSSTNTFANLIIALTSLFLLSYLPPVQEGGLEVVADMWTEQGTENPDAVWRNLFIDVCWAFASVSVGIVLPPWRTSRRMLTRGLFPGMFQQVNTVLSGSDDANVDSLVKSKASLKGGSVVMTTAFEPRLCNPTLDLVRPLKQIAVATDEMIVRSLLVLKFKAGLTESPNEAELVQLQNASTVLEKSGQALSSNDQAQYDSLQECIETDSQQNEEETAKSENKPQSSVSNYIYQQAQQVRLSTLEYLQAFNQGITTNTTKQQKIFLWKQAVSYVSSWMSPTIALLKFPKLMLHPKQWDFKAIMWAVELTGGFVALLAMALYWDDFSNFRIEPRQGYVGPVYSGWHMLGYAFAFQPTHEGTTKKGIQRILGTCLGGFSAWLGIIVCSGSYDDDAEIDPYGLVAWLTVFSMICAYFFSLESGTAAFFGSGKDHGFVGMYFSLTQALVAIEVYRGAGDKNGITLNRIVATSSGVLMAIIISFLPPHVNGRDPKQARAYVSALNDAFMLLLRTFADEEENSKIASDDFQNSLLSDANRKCKWAVFALDNADMLQFLPFYKVNQDLRPLLDYAGVTEAVISHLQDDLSRIISENLDATETRSLIATFVQKLESEGSTTMETPSDSEGKDITLVRCYDIARQLGQLKQQLNKIESQYNKQFW